jgi:hypothetical protein
MALWARRLTRYREDLLRRVVPQYLRELDIGNVSLFYLLHDLDDGWTATKEAVHILRVAFCFSEGCENESSS